MRLHHEFDDALADLRDNGGAMNYTSANSTGPESWQVWYAEEFREMDYDPYVCTLAALQAGGMSASEAYEELADWQT